MSLMLPALKGVQDDRLADAAEKRAAQALLDGLAQTHTLALVTSSGRESALDRIGHFARAFDIDALHPGRGPERDRPCHQRHPRAQRGGGGGNREALLPARAVGDIAHRIDRLVRRPRGDEDAAAVERA